MHMQRMLKAAGHEMPQGAPILEINPEHEMIRRLDAGNEAGDFNDWATLLLEQAVLTDGGHLDDPSGFVRRMNDLLVR